MGLPDLPESGAADGGRAAAERSREVAESLRVVRSRIAQAAARVGRDPASVRLVGVSKGQSAAVLGLAIAAGLRECGENRVQEALGKIAALNGVRWHLIGRLQRNKCRAVAGRFDLVHSVDRPELAEALHRAAERAGARQDVLLQVSLAGLPGQGGVAPSAAAGLLARVRSLHGLRPVGLMVIAPPAGDPEEARPFFSTLRALRDRLRAETGLALPELSMGMSADYAVAVEEGATLVRVGRAIFGPPPGAA